MSIIFNSNLGYNALSKLAKEDYVASAIISYYKYLNDSKILIENKSSKDNSNIKEIAQIYKNISVSMNELNKLLVNNLDISLNNNVNKYDLDFLVSLYINKNYEKLINNKYVKNNLNSIVEKLDECFSPEIKASIVLRMIKIFNQLKNDTKAIDNFIQLLDACKGSRKDQIIYIIYAGLFCAHDKNDMKYYFFNSDKIYTVNKKPTQENMNDQEKEITDKLFSMRKKVVLSLLNNKLTLPDNIIISLCKDPQFDKYNSDDRKILVFIIGMIFLYSGTLPEEDDYALIQKLFENDISDFDSKARFLDVKELFDKAKDYFYNNVSNDQMYFEKIIMDLLCDKMILPKNDEKSDNYGSI